MSKVAIDTNIITKILNGTIGKVIPQSKMPTELYIPLTVYAESRGGSLAGANPKRFIAQLDAFIARNDVHLSKPINIETAEAYANIYADLKKCGTPVSPNDMWIAAECVTQNFVLLTLDSDFDKMPQVRRFAL